MNSGSADVNMIGGYADSLSLNPKVRLRCSIKEWQGAEESYTLLSSRHNKKAERLYDYDQPNKRKLSISKGIYGD